MLNKYLIPVYVGLFILLNQNIAFSQNSGNKKQSFGYISITMPADSATVFLNKAFLGNTPISNRAIPVGRHQLHAVLKRSPEWYKNTWQQKFEIFENDSLTFQVAPTRQLYLNSQPYGAQVIFQNHAIGSTPYFFTLADSTSGLVVLRKPGYLDYIIKLGDIKTPFVEAQLKVDQQTEEAKLQFTSIIQNRQKRRKILTYSMLGLTIASGITAIYFKSQADSRYDDYLAASNPDAMNRLYNETQRFDDYTAVSYGVFQVSFVTSLYLLLFKK